MRTLHSLVEGRLSRTHRGGSRLLRIRRTAALQRNPLFAGAVRSAMDWTSGPLRLRSNSAVGNYGSAPRRLRRVSLAGGIGRAGIRRSSGLTTRWSGRDCE
jgi:hypothetical protein